MTDAIPGSSSWLTDQSLDLALSDAFDVSGFVGRLSDLVETGDPPFTISLSGSWGLGKSTVAEGLVASLKLRGIPSAIIDAWTEDVEHLRRTLTIAVGAELCGGPEHREEVAKEIDAAIHVGRTDTLPPKPELRILDSLQDLRKRPEVFVWLAAIDLWFLFFTVASAVWAPAATSAFSTLLGASLVFTALQTGFFFRIVTTTESRAPAQESVETADRFRRIVTKSDGAAPEKVVVVVDNLDRLQGCDALRALAEIRALVEIKGSRAIFLIPIDRGALARHIEPSLGPTDGPEDSPDDSNQPDGLAAKDYLEKFFNLDLLLMRPEVLDLRQWALGEARRVLPAAHEMELVTAAQVIASAGNGSPRTVKRIINGVSARVRLIDPRFNPRPSLAQIALVEGLLTQYPEVVAWLGRDPREFVDYRASLSSDHGAVAAPLARRREQQLRTYLLANAEVELTPAQVRMMMSLRLDRVWQGVADADQLQEALDTGQASQFQVALTALDASDRSVAIDRSIAYIERSVPRFARDAMTNLIAIAPAVSDYPDAAKTLRPMAIEALRIGDDANRRRISRGLAEFVFAPPREHRHLANVADKLAGTLISGGEVTQDLVWAVRAAADYFNAGSIDRVRGALGGLTDYLLAPIFEEPIEVGLADGPVASQYLGRLISWDCSAEQTPVVIAAERLGLLFGAGWAPPDVLDQIAARVTSQLPSVGQQAEPALDAILSLFQSASQTDELDRLAISLSTNPGLVNPAERLAWVLYLPVGPAAKPTVINGVTAWLRSVRPDLAEGLILAHKEALATFGYDPTPVLTARWIAGDGRPWAELAAEVNAGADPALLTRVLPATPDLAYGGPVAEAAGIAEARRETPSAGSLVADIAVRAGTLPPGVIGKLGETLASLRRTGADLSPVVAALTARIGTDPAVGLLTHAVRLLHDHGIKEMRQLAGPLAARGSAAGGVQLEDVEWLVRGSGGSSESRKVLVRAIESEPIAKVCPIVDRLVDPLRRNADIRFALVRRVGSGVDEAEVNLLLDSAVPWKMPGPDQLDPYRQMLSQINIAWPTTTERVNRLQ